MGVDCLLFRRGKAKGEGTTFEKLPSLLPVHVPEPAMDPEERGKLGGRPRK